MRMLKLFLVQLFLLILLIGCNGTAEGPGYIKHEESPENEDLEDIEDSLDVQEIGHGQQTTDEDQEQSSTKTYDQTPGLRGGSEQEAREPNPVDNFELQQAFPDVVALQGPMDEMEMALTFDDGPDEVITPAVLDKLDEYDVKATFFLIGERAEAHPDIVQQIVDEGHMIANHSWDHPKFTDISNEEVEEQIDRTETALHDITGEAVRMFRPPYGAQNEDTVRTVGALNYSNVIWSQDSLDWKEMEAEDTADNILSDITYGAIVLQHSAGGEDDEDLMNTVEALDKVIPELKDDGIEFVTVDELLDIRPYR
ncbi:peptidoglycan/xylan/chitin deacetylase (PgdA/CDA1 family) [Geomicrobium halophilum]|uniref:Peptidoglycan/xylan/chitin deacetylase (PgdA/CDA1 family) n=1 Tax=Geomicrobium halophilum TaxID=549000 RepID=A0A841Q2B4_9BACL|nr:polysaccharide deacetylase family protein [Geomicrobium halophilum]MBB6450408.1 peptidoglycan/xylan/chitin deacetylase (PgdA/CDA1 family) [Geomicrobium halophilum]